MEIWHIKKPIFGIFVDPRHIQKPIFGTYSVLTTSLSITITIISQMSLHQQLSIVKSGTLFSR